MTGAMLPETFRSMIYGAAIRAAAGRDPGKVAVDMAGHETSFGELAQRIGRLRDAAIALGVAKGDVVAIVSRNRPEFTEVVAGVPYAGAAVATINPRLAPAEIAQALGDCGARLVFTDPDSRALVEAAGVPGLHLVTFGGTYEALLADAPAPALRPTIDEWDLWPIPYFGETVLHELYAATETGLVCNLRPKDQLRKVSCVGTTFPHVEAEVRREGGSVCDADEVGELWCRNPVLFSGYWNRPEETAKAVRDGWVSVGDMARRDTEGFLYIVARKKDMVIPAGSTSTRARWKRCCSPSHRSPTSR